MAKVMRESIQPLHRKLRAIVRELLGPGASEQQVMLCLMSIDAQCFDPVVRERCRDVFAKVGFKHRTREKKISIEQIADYVTRFTLAGIREVCRQIESGSSSQTE